MTFNAANLTRCSPANVTGPALYLYYSPVDNVATVGASTYFEPFGNSYSQLGYPFQLNVGDNIEATCPDGFIQLYITSISPITTAQQTVIDVVGPNSVNTNSIQNLAVTTGKINDLAVTTGKLAANAVTEAKIAAATITTASISGTAGILGSQLSATAGIVTGQIAANTIVAGNIAANTITATQLALSVPQDLRFSISSANFKTIFSAGQQIIAAAGANTIIIIDSVTYSFNFLTASYTAGGVIQLQYSTAAPAAANGIAATTGVAAATVTGLAATGYITDTGVLAINGAAGLVNAGIWLTAATANFATGAGNLVLNVKYRVITV